MDAPCSLLQGRIMYPLSKRKGKACRMYPFTSRAIVQPHLPAYSRGCSSANGMVSSVENEQPGANIFGEFRAWLVDGQELSLIDVGPDLRGFTWRRQMKSIRIESDVIFCRDVEVRMRDGVRLLANIFRPAVDGPCPVVMSVTPYGKDMLPDWI